MATSKILPLSDEAILEHISLLTNTRQTFRAAMLDPANLERDCPLDNGRHHDAPSKVSSLGRLHRLPTEVLHMIFLDVDLESLTTMRRVSRGARNTIDAIWQYRDIIHHAPNSIRAALSIKVGSLVSCRRLYEELCSQECATCGRFGPYLYLLSFTRACYICLTENPRFLPMTPGHARQSFGISIKDKINLPTALSIPGSFSNVPKIRRGRISLVDRAHSKEVGIRLHGSLERMEQFVAQATAEDLSRYKARLADPLNAFRCPSQHTRRPAHTQILDAKAGNPERFMCVVKFPWLDRISGKLEWGLNCTGCRDLFHHNTDEKLDFRWLYTRNGYLAHIRELGCHKSIKLLESLI